LREFAGRNIDDIDGARIHRGDGDELAVGGYRRIVELARVAKAAELAEPGASAFRERRGVELDDQRGFVGLVLSDECAGEETQGGKGEKQTRERHWASPGDGMNGNGIVVPRVTD